MLAWLADLCVPWGRGWWVQTAPLVLCYPPLQPQDPALAPLQASDPAPPCPALGSYAISRIPKDTALAVPLLQGQAG